MGEGRAPILRLHLRFHPNFKSRVQVGVGGALAIVVAAELQPQFVAKLLQMLAFTTLSPLLLPLLLPRICDPKPSQEHYKFKHLRRCCHCCCHCCCAGFAALNRRKNVTNQRVYDTAAIVVAIVVATHGPSQKHYKSTRLRHCRHCCWPGVAPQTLSHGPAASNPSASDPQPQTLSPRPSTSDPQLQTPSLRP